MACGAGWGAPQGVAASWGARRSRCRLRRAEAASAVWIPHWNSEPCESQGARAAKGYVAQQVLKKNREIGVGFSSPPFRSSDFAGPRRPRLYGFHTGTRSLSNRKGRGRRNGGRARSSRSTREQERRESNPSVLTH